MFFNNPQVLIAIITGSLAVAGTVWVQILRNRAVLRGKQPGRKDPIEVTLDVMQAGMKQAYEENDRLRKSLEQSTIELEKAHKIIQTQQDYIATTLLKVQQAQDINQELIEQLHNMRKQYNKLGTSVSNIEIEDIGKERE